MTSINPSGADQAEKEVIILPENQEWLSSKQAYEQFGINQNRLSKAVNSKKIQTKLDPSNKSAKLYLAKDVADYCKLMGIEKPSQGDTQVNDMSDYAKQQVEYYQKQNLAKDELIAKLSQNLVELTRNQQTLQRELQNNILPKLEEKPTQDLSQDLAKLQESQQILQNDIRNIILPKINQLEEKPAPKRGLFGTIFGWNNKDTN